MSAELWAAVRELQRVSEAMLRTGVVASVNGAEVTISYPDLPDSEPMPYLASSAAFDASPTVGDQAFVFMPSGDPLMACALCGVSSTDKDAGAKSGAARADLVEAELDAIRDAITNAAVVAQDGGANLQSTITAAWGTRGDVDANKVQVD